MNSENYSLESLEKGFQNFNETFTQGVRDVEDQIRSTPLIAVAASAVVGYMLNLLPIGGILRLIFKLVTVLHKTASRNFWSCEALRVYQEED